MWTFFLYFLEKLSVEQGNELTMPIQKKAHIKSLFLMLAVFKKLNLCSAPYVVPNWAFIFWAEGGEKLKEKKQIEETSLQNRKGEYCRDYKSQIPWSHSKYMLISWVTWTEIVYPNLCPILQKCAFIFFFTVNTSLRNCDHVAKDQEFLSDFYLPTFNAFF